jgi:hypothetical protein
LLFTKKKMLHWLVFCNSNIFIYYLLINTSAMNHIL